MSSIFSRLALIRAGLKKRKMVKADMAVSGAFASSGNLAWTSLLITEKKY
jgi:hypothetical protein